MMASPFVLLPIVDPSSAVVNDVPSTAVSIRKSCLLGRWPG